MLLRPVARVRIIIHNQHTLSRDLLITAWDEGGQRGCGLQCTLSNTRGWPVHAPTQRVHQWSHGTTGGVLRSSDTLDVQGARREPSLNNNSATLPFLSLPFPSLLTHPVEARQLADRLARNIHEAATRGMRDRAADGV